MSIKCTQIIGLITCNKYNYLPPMVFKTLYTMHIQKSPHTPNHWLSEFLNAHSSKSPSEGEQNEHPIPPCSLQPLPPRSPLLSNTVGSSWGRLLLCYISGITASLFFQSLPTVWCLWEPPSHCMQLQTVPSHSRGVCCMAMPPLLTHSTGVGHLPRHTALLRTF